MRPSDHERGCQGREYTCTCGYDAARDEEIERLKGERDETVGWIGTVECPCTTFEQDETCPVGYPSLLCGACGGKGVVRAETVIALAAEMLKIAEQVDELEDPFAAWESIELLKSASLSDLSVSGEAARIGDAVLSWLVKFDLADAGNEYRAEDVVNILNELAPVSQPQSDRSVSGDAVRVKQLEWQMLPPPYGTYPLRPTALTSLGVYKIIFIILGDEKKETYFALLGEMGLGNRDTIEEAKKLAQDHWDLMVRSALVTSDRTEEGRDETFTREQIEAHVNKRLEEFAIAQQSVSASKDELIRELVRALKPFGEEADCYEPDTGDNDDTPWATPAYFKIRDLRAARAAITLASEAGYNEGGEK